MPRQVVLLMVAICLIQVTALTTRPHMAFSVTSAAPSMSSLRSPLTCQYVTDPKQRFDDTSRSTFFVYKDDCFGFITFLGGIAVQDILFTSLFVSFSLGADFLARLKILPPDSKRASVVDRKVPGLIAILTLVLASVGSGILSTENALLTVQAPPDLGVAREAQLLICSFSAITAFLDIRWRDRFDYGPDDQVQ